MWRGTRTAQVTKTKKIVRAIAILDHCLPGTNDCDSCQVIFPQRQVNRKNDIYLFQCGYNHHVSPHGKYLAFASTIVDVVTNAIASAISATHAAITIRIGPTWKWRWKTSPYLIATYS